MWAITWVLMVFWWCFLILDEVARKKLGTGEYELFELVSFVLYAIWIFVFLLNAALELIRIRKEIKEIKKELEKLKRAE